MAYGLAYSIPFKTFDNDNGLVILSQKDYVGASGELTGGTSPVIIQYKSGDYYANDAIRGCEVQINYYNEGDAPLSTFASNDDNEWKVDVYLNNELKFTGFISQDDCREDMLSTPYLVTLTATDSLGLLKDLYFTDLNGDIVYSQLTLLQCFQYILTQTGLSIPVNIFCNIFETATNNRYVNPANEPFSQTKIDARMFLLTSESQQDINSSLNPVQLSDIVQDCYTVLQNILDAWNCTILQANGQWHIIRWIELKDYNNVIPGTRYDENFSNPISVDLSPNVKSIGIGQPIKFIGATQQRYLFRANKYIKLQYNYEQPAKIILNDDLQSLGGLISTTTTGTGTALKTFKNYVWNDWTIDPSTGTTAVIRVTYDYLGLEIDRYGVIAGGSGGQISAVLGCTPFNVNKGDRFTISFDFITSDSESGTSNIIFNFKLTDGTNTMYLKTPGTGLPAIWATSPGVVYTITDNTNISHTFSVDAPAIPFNGKLTMYYTQSSFNNQETQYKGLSLRYTSYVQGEVQIIGQYHQSTAPYTTKKFLNKQIYLDDSPSYNIKGAMLLPDGLTPTKRWLKWINYQPSDFSFIQLGSLYLGIKYNGPGTVKTSVYLEVVGAPGYFILMPWGNPSVTFAGAGLPNLSASGGYTISVSFSPGDAGGYQFGFIQKLDMMFLTDNFRVKIDGSFLGIKNRDGFMAMFNVFQLDELPGVYFILGQVAFDLANSQWTGTLEEFWRDSDNFDPNQFANIFSYLYQQ